MQALYALRQAEFSNQQLAIDGINDLFHPDLNSMLPRINGNSEGYRKLAGLLFEEAIKSNQPAKDEDGPDQGIEGGQRWVYFLSKSLKKRSSTTSPKC